MKLNFKWFISAVLATGISVHAKAGNENGNGGDICENRFKIIREDIQNWILRGGSAALQLPSGVSNKQYDEVMLRKFKTAKVSCTDDRIFIGRAEKSCKNYVASDGTVLINCNVNRFMGTSESGQYVLVHHEYAGLAGFEVNKDEDSTYLISNQLTSYLEDQVVKRLAVRPRPSKSVCAGSATHEGIKHLFSSGQTTSRNLGPIEMSYMSRDCNLVSGCNTWKLYPADLIYAWCNPNCDYNQYKSEEATSISSPTSSYFWLEGIRSNIVFSFDISDSKNRLHTFQCQINPKRTDEVECSRKDSWTSWLKWNDGRVLAFRGVVSNDCLQLVSQSSVQSGSLTRESKIILKSVW